MILLIDNYDSFTYNLVDLIGTVSLDVLVLNRDECNLKEIKKMSPSHIIISSGPANLNQPKIYEKLIMEYKDKIPIIGIGLGHHIIGEIFGAETTLANPLMHGKAISIHIASGNGLFFGLSPVIQVGAYYSKILKRELLPDELLIIGENEREEIMAIKHRDYDIYGLQFNPESILTPAGKKIIENFLMIGGASK
ncbi:anthranilate synthase component 2 [Herbinix hemicellulosilytica]|uniref:Glutamine amidotransferase domain-containing protein n=1 Tax=Herbinix hemicellulosilytica TaxID=1564487 RepID=A0A0H5STT7_HERHM|nr:aminodeoxychorismate/anthranilate synthase component II [Herbinix hemicellulosilytica]RBP57504.1 anthranilate synthase component 2 [Herbinix hemicellulosilytica]CRZ33723.1 hypothetical protein HHT355_0518 [Herbinix hemicellulosilytica]